MTNSQTNFKQERSVARAKPPFRDLGPSNSRSYNDPKVETSTSNYDPETDPYYSKTAYTGMESPEKHYLFNDNNNDYVKNRYKRLFWAPEIKGDDYIAGQPPEIFRKKPIEQSDNFFIPIPEAAVEREQKTYEIEYFYSQHNFASKLYFLSMLGFVMSTFGTALFFISALLVFFLDNNHSITNLLSYLVYVPLVFIGFFILWKFSIWIARKLPDNKFRKLKRRTGMICFPQRGKKPDIEIPFSEFEPRYYVGASPSTLFHRLVYVHKSGNPIFSAGENTIGDVYTKAAYLEQFMNITKPLPDMPNLEWCRDKDPTTAAYDKATHRDPNYWRNKSSKEIETIAGQHEQKIKLFLGKSSFNV